MAIVFVTDSQPDWANRIPNVELVDPHEYLTASDWCRRRHIKLYNLAGSYQYQSLGYYVSLLAEARGHRPFPSVMTIQDLQKNRGVGFVPPELEELINRSLAPIQSDRFTLSIYFGRNLAARYNRLASALSAEFQAPLLKVEFKRRKRHEKEWRIHKVRALGLAEIPESHQDFVAEQALAHCSRRIPKGTKKPARFDLAIFHNPEEGDLAPSNEQALKKMIKAAAKLGIHAELITREDAGRLLEFDALFLRETTAVNHHTYRLARRAEREGLVVLDDPRSILLCSNKVYLAEMLNKAKIPIPKTIVAHRGNAASIPDQLGFPLVLKQPDSAFSKGVVKVKSDLEFATKIDEFFSTSELVVAQQYMQTEFDWRIGILDRRPIFACKYHMARGHWQIIKHDSHSRGRFGKCETLPVELAPPKAVSIACKAADLIGDGLYGVDVKESKGKFYVIEVNDNPNLDAGVEDQILRGDLYRILMESFLRRIEQAKSAESPT
jgi:glutathione synthase/RimK-type ligase-like ATP-grasp enzyme